MLNSEKECFFCNSAKSEAISSSDFLFVVRDNKFPVTKHHTLIAPHRHVSDFFDLSNDELNDLSKVLKKQRQLLLNLDKKITGFNVGVNAGIDAGQSIMHCHIHLIPRRKGDMENPKGGVRGVIPSKQKYSK
ncbi:HIT family protein [bacterium]|nr:HIT family protein [bacterium]